jgi:hypothetical protein
MFLARTSWIAPCLEQLASQKEPTFWAFVFQRKPL